MDESWHAIDRRVEFIADDLPDKLVIVIAFDAVGDLRGVLSTIGEDDELPLGPLALSGAGGRAPS